MKQILDEEGKKVKNLFRNEDCIVVKDEVGLNLYKARLQEKKRLEKVEQELSEIKMLLKSILEKQG